MNLNFNQPMHTIEGRPMKHVEDIPKEDGSVERVITDFTYAKAAQEALSINDDVPAQEKNRRFLLACRIYQSTVKGGDHPATVQLDLEDALLIKTLVARLYDPVVTGRFYEFLDEPTAN